MPAFPNGHALVIGVSEYADSQWNVPIAATDAQAIHTALIDPQQGGYPAGHAELITGAQATRAGIMAGLNRLANRLRPGDTALISFTGHGAPGSDGLYYLGAYDMAFDGRQITTDTGVSIADLGKALRRLRNESILLLLNACFAGAALPALAGGGIAPEKVGAALPDAAGNRLLVEATEPASAGRAIITASRADQFSRFTTKDGLSVFTQALLSALRGGDGSWAGSNVIGLFELYTYLHKQVPLLTQNALGSIQEPLITVLQGAGNFAVAAASGGVVVAGTDLMPTLPDNLPAQRVGRDLIVAHAGSTVTIDNRQEAPLVSFGANSSIGDVKIGDVARGDIVKTYGPGSAPAAEEATIDPAKLLPRLAQEIGQARFVDEDQRDEAAGKITLAAKAFGRGDVARTLERITEALELLAPLRANGYVNSRARKLEQVRETLQAGA